MTDTTKTIQFGEHLMIDGYGGDFDKLNNKELVLKCLDELPEKLGMKKLSQPEVYKGVPNGKKDPGGWTGVVTIDESHISIHTFAGRKFLSADVYTCKEGMDIDFILNYFKEMFDLKDIEHHFIKRGNRYPAEDLV